MKRIFLILVVVLLISIVACGILSNDDDTGDTTSDAASNGDAQNNTASGGSTVTTCTHTWKSATCTEPKTCSKCRETSGAALGHTTESGICSRCGENFSAWTIGEYTDEFKQPTGKKYMIVETDGKFSNSATTDSELHAALQVDKEKIGIMLWEYGDNLVKGIFDSENYSITILDKENAKHYFTGTIYDGGIRIYFKDADRSKLLTLLQSNDTLTIYMESNKYTTSTYLFSLSTKDFDATYNLIK